MAGLTRFREDDHLGGAPVVVVGLGVGQRRAGGRGSHLTGAVQRVEGDGPGQRRRDVGPGPEAQLRQNLLLDDLEAPRAAGRPVMRVTGGGAQQRQEQQQQRGRSHVIS